MNAVLRYDRVLLASAGLLIAIGLLMVASASVVISDRIFGHPFHFLTHQAICIALGLGLTYLVAKVDLAFWQRLSGVGLILSFVFLILVLIPGLGHQVNGSMRWIGIGPVGIQVSEFVKLAILIYLASYLVRHQKEIKTRTSGFLKPLIILALIDLLLLKEPDFGTASVIMATALGVMFIAGVQLWQFAVLLSGIAITLSILAISSPYRIERLTSFLNPWADRYASGYQLTQSLIAFGRGGWFGVGLGDSVQKLFYLPEAHTDFLYAVLAEELGLVGAVFVIGLFALFIGRALDIAYKAYRREYYFAAYLGFGLSLWLALQVMINLGVNLGVLPTKGLTLPLMSYGGSSILATCIALGLLLRIDFETRNGSL